MPTLKRLVETLFEKTNIIHNNKDRVRIGVFISIPKNASKSIRKILELGENRDHDNTSSLIIHENHQRGAILHQKYDLHNLFVFCFVRNPYDRCVSWYEYHKDIEPYRSLSFSSWVKRGMPHHVTIQNQTDYEKEGISPLLQLNYIENTKLDLIGRMENFDNDLKTIIEKLNTICRDMNIPHSFTYSDTRIHTSDRVKEFEQYYDQETREIVYSLLKRDFEELNYDK